MLFAETDDLLDAVSLSYVVEEPPRNSGGLYGVLWHCHLMDHRESAKERVVYEVDAVRGSDHNLVSVQLVELLHERHCHSG